MKVELRSITPNAERLIAEAARVSRRGDGKPTGLDRDRATIRRLIRDGHDSVLEHASATFLVEGISRCCMAQLTRHRHASFTVESQRYVNVGDAGAVAPESIAADSKTGDAYWEAVLGAKRAYGELVDEGVPEEDARYVLPGGTVTRLIVTANFREWRHIIRQRAHPAAQWEIRELVTAIQAILAEHAPSVFGLHEEAK